MKYDDKQKSFVMDVSSKPKVMHLNYLKNAVAHLKITFWNKTSLNLWNYELYLQFEFHEMKIKHGNKNRWTTLIDSSISYLCNMF